LFFWEKKLLNFTIYNFEKFSPHLDPEKISQCESHKGFYFLKNSYKVAIFLRFFLKLPYLDTVTMIEVNWHSLILKRPREKKKEKKKEKP
jgi:hypothetical protein